MVNYVRPLHGDPFADGSATDLTVILDALSDGLEAVETATGLSLIPSGGDDTAALNAAVAAVTAGRSLTLRGTFATTGTVTVNCNLNAADATFSYTGTGTAVIVGTSTSGQSVSRIRVILPRVIAASKVSTGWAEVAGSIGVDLSNLNSCYVEVPFVQSFETGLRCYGKGVGNVHNTVLIGHLDNNKVNHLAAASATGWSNQNLYLGGKFSHNSVEGTAVSGTRQIEMAVTTNPVNNNLWLNPSVEGNVPEFHAIVAGAYNVIVNGRWEAVTPKVKWATDAANNDIRGGYGAASIVETLAGSGSGNNVSSSTRVNRQASAGTIGLMVLENVSSGAYSSDVVMNAGAKEAGDSPVTAYCVSRSAATTRMKRSTDVSDRLKLDHSNGRVYFGEGGSDPTAYIGAFSPTEVALIGSSWLFGTDNEKDIGGSANYRPRDVFVARDVKAGGVVKSQAVATGSRPSAATSGAGAMIYDTTLSKPVWSNGSVWKDAAGNTV